MRTVFSNRGRFEQLIRTRTVDEPGQVACATPQVSPAIGCQRRLYQKPSSLFVCLDFDCCCLVAWCSVFELDYPISPFRIAKTTTSQSTHLLPGSVYYEKITQALDMVEKCSQFSFCHSLRLLFCLFSLCRTNE